jgi:YesN/AraC family two-component response regulator
VVEARDGREALHLFQAEPPEVVLLDLIMPHQEGLETIVELHRLDPGVKIIAISGGGLGRAESYLKIARRIGAVSTLTKPFSTAAMVEAIAAAVKKK